MTMKEALEKRNAAFEAVDAFRKANPLDAEWGDDKTTEWARLNAAFDAADAGVADAKSREDQIAARSQEFDRIAQRVKDVPALERAYRPAMETGNPLELQRRALNAWAAGGRGGKARAEDVEAAQRLGIDLTSNDFDLSLYSSPAYAEFRVQHSLAGGSGGYLVQSPILAGSLEKALLDYSGVRSVAEVIRTDTGADLQWPGYDDTSNTGELLPAPSTEATDQDIAFTQKVWKAYEYSSKGITVHRSLYQDSNFDILSIVSGVAGERLGRIQNTHFTTGDGNAKPYGIVTASALGVSAAGASAITYDELMGLEHSIDIAYRNQGCGYMFSDSTALVLRKLKNGVGEYLWRNGDGSQPTTLNGYRITINNSMASVASGNKSVLFGLLNKYKIRDVQGMTLQRFVETKGKKNQDEFVAIMRTDGNLLTAGQTVVAHLLQA